VTEQQVENRTIKKQEHLEMRNADLSEPKLLDSGKVVMGDDGGEVIKGQQACALDMDGLRGFRQWNRCVEASGGLL